MHILCVAEQDLAKDMFVQGVIYSRIDGTRAATHFTDSEIVMLDGTFWGDSFEQNRSWDDSGTTISGI